MKKNKIVYTTLVGDNFNEGHKKVIKKAFSHGKVIVGLMTDEACTEYTSLPHFDYKTRKDNLLKIYPKIYKIIPQKSLDYK